MGTGTRQPTRAKAVRNHGGPTVIHRESDPLLDVATSEAWWDIPIPQISELEATKQAFQMYIDHKIGQRRLG